MKRQKWIERAAEELSEQGWWSKDDKRIELVAQIIEKHFLPKPEIDDPAEQIYGLYPRKVGKLDALKAIRKALKTTPKSELIDAVTAYAYSVKGTDPAFIPHPATWFNAGRWMDDRSTWQTSQSPAPSFRAAAPLKAS